MAINQKLSEALKGNNNAAKNHIKKAISSVKSGAAKVGAAVSAGASKMAGKAADKLVERSAKENAASKAAGGGYKYSIGGYIATKRKQTDLNNAAAGAKQTANYAKAVADRPSASMNAAGRDAATSGKSMLSNLKAGNFQEAKANAKFGASALKEYLPKALSKAGDKARSAIASKSAESASKAAKDYTKVSSPSAYAKGAAKAGVANVKKAASTASSKIGSSVKSMANAGAGKARSVVANIRTNRKPLKTPTSGANKRGAGYR